MNNDILSTFVLVHENEIISPVLVTIREYGKWYESVFGKYTAQQELYMRSKKKNGESVLEWHPGTKIGKWFDTQNIQDPSYQSWFFIKDSTMMDKLVKLKLAEYKDSIPIAVNDTEGRNMIRVYTVKQVELYIRNTLDKKFNISAYITIPKQIKIQDSDFGKMEIPKVDIQRKRLF